jgi:hypothetical protein
MIHQSLKGGSEQIQIEKEILRRGMHIGEPKHSHFTSFSSCCFLENGKDFSTKRCQWWVKIVKLLPSQDSFFNKFCCVRVPVPEYWNRGRVLEHAQTSMHGTPGFRRVDWIPRESNDHVAGTKVLQAQWGVLGRGFVRTTTRWLAEHIPGHTLEDVGINTSCLISDNIIWCLFKLSFPFRCSRFKQTKQKALPIQRT